MKEDNQARTIEQAWDLVDAYTKFELVTKCWRKVLSLIILGKGGSSLVEKCRGLLRLLNNITVLLVNEDEVLDDVEDGEQQEEDLGNYEYNEILM